MAKTHIDQTSSIGATWPPAPSTHNRLRGFYGDVIDTEVEARNFVGAFNGYAYESAEDPSISRLSVRAIMPVDLVRRVENSGIVVEAALPLREQDLVIAYFAKNKPDRLVDEATLSLHKNVLAEITGSPAAGVNYTQLLLEKGLQPTVINNATPGFVRRSLVQEFTALYGIFGYTSGDVEDILLNPANTIAYVADENGIVSTAMVERVDVRINGIGKLRLAEITEAATRPSDRNKGLYRAVSGLLVESIRANDASIPDVLYGESNLAMQGVLRAAQQNGRKFSFGDRQKFGIRNPNFGILQQNFKIDDGVETRPYNDFAVSYFAL